MPAIQVTADWLASTNPCFPEHLDILRAEWPDGAVVNRPNLIRASALGLRVIWMADRLCPAAAGRFEALPMDRQRWRETYANVLQIGAADEAERSGLLSAVATAVRLADAMVELGDIEPGGRAELSRGLLRSAAESGWCLIEMAEKILDLEDLERFRGSLHSAAREAWDDHRASPSYAERRRACVAATDALKVAIAPHLAEHNARLAAAKTDEERAASLATFRAETAHHYAACRAITDGPDVAWSRVEKRIQADVLADCLGLD